ncbi:hypothetical protein SESBI_46879 [Sesbania bispinosa]|nr:hypothetical protein SESBI_46879 [Sesbania bispinosa]
MNCGGRGSYEELKESVLSYPDERKLQYLDSYSTLRISVDSFGKVISLKEQKELKGLSYVQASLMAMFELGRATVYWKTMNGLPPTSASI